MCGIAGIISLNSAKIENGISRVNHMLDKMKHRGPDSSGIFQNDNKTVILGNNRLAITDPSFNINGPLTDEDNIHTISYNGEIYDYKTHLNNLKGKGFNFHSKTDTEVLLKGLIYEGLDFLNIIDGCWAFALYNNKTKKVTISRDLLGEKHVFYYKNNEEFIFASEASAVASVIKDTLSFNLNEVFTSMRFFSSSYDHTIISNIKKLKPGQSIIISNGKKNNIESFYPCKFDPLEWKDFFNANPSDDQVIKNLSELLFNSVKNRLSPDVPFFTTLSGGIDSNLITYFASCEKKNLDTVYIKTSEKMTPSKPDEELNEKEASSFTAKLLKTNHLELEVESNQVEKLLNKNAENSLDGLLDWGTSSFELIGEAIKKQGYKVLLVSEAADELCGYKSDMINFLKYNFKKKNPFLINTLNKLNHYHVIRKVFRKINLIAKNIQEPYCSEIPYISRPFHEALGIDYLSKCFTREVVNHTNGKYGGLNKEYYQLDKILDYSQKMALSYMNLSIPSFNNLRIDRALMAASVEPRIPFLNIKLVNFFLAMPHKYRYRNGIPKYILRKMVEKYIGKKIAWRKKHGFSFPIWRLPGIKENLNLEERVFNSNIISSLPWKKNGKNFLKRNIGHKMSKLSWPLFAISKIEDAHNIKKIKNN